MRHKDPCEAPRRRKTGQKVTNNAELLLSHKSLCNPTYP